MRTFFSAVVLALAMAGATAFAPRSSVLARATTSGVALRAEATKADVKLPASVKPGVVTGEAFRDLLQYAQDKEFAIPGVNIVGECLHMIFTSCAFALEKSCLVYALEVI